jgi:hypothetical protein
MGPLATALATAMPKGAIGLAFTAIVVSIGKFPSPGSEPERAKGREEPNPLL